MIINGQRIVAEQVSPVYNPFTNEIVGEVPAATEKQITDAVLGAAAVDGRLFGAAERKTVLLKTVEYINNHKDELSRLITSESGLSLKDTLYEVGRVANVFLFAAKTVDMLEADPSERYRIHDELSTFQLNVVSEPLTAALAITPFNHPMNQVAHKVAPAIAAGTPLVLKPSEKTPLSALKLSEILHEQGLPAGMLNVITCDAPDQFLKDALALHKVELVTFTGGVSVGKIIAKEIVNTGNELIRYIPELGGNSALTVLDDADVELAASIAMNAYANSGQRCTSIKRILLHDAVADDFIHTFLEKTKQIRYGDPFNPETDMGTVIDQASASAIKGRVDDAVASGAELLYGNMQDGALYSPTLLDKVKPNTELVVKETFGPVAPIIRISGIDEAVEIINSVNFKLASAVVSADSEKALHIANAVQVGQFNWNNSPGFRTEAAPFGGFGDSGNGEKEGVIMAAEGLRKIRTFYEHRQ